MVHTAKTLGTPHGSSGYLLMVTKPAFFQAMIFRAGGISLGNFHAYHPRRPSQHKRLAKHNVTALITAVGTGLGLRSEAESESRL